MKSTYYDVVLYKKDAAVNKQIKKVSVRQKQTLDYKQTIVGHGKDKLPVSLHEKE